MEQVPTERDREVAPAEEWAELVVVVEWVVLWRLAQVEIVYAPVVDTKNHMFRDNHVIKKNAPSAVHL